MRWRFAAHVDAAGRRLGKPSGGDQPADALADAVGFRAGGDEAVGRRNGQFQARPIDHHAHAAKAAHVGTAERKHAAVQPARSDNPGDRAIHALQAKRPAAGAERFVVESEVWKGPSHRRDGLHRTFKPGYTLAHSTQSCSTAGLSLPLSTRANWPRLLILDHGNIYWSSTADSSMSRIFCGRESREPFDRLTCMYGIGASHPTAELCRGGLIGAFRRQRAAAGRFHGATITGSLVLLVTEQEPSGW